MSSLILHLGQAILIAAGMFWQVGWSLVLGFVLSGAVQAFVSKEAMRKQLGRDGAREIALATLYGAASSSCSYASAAVSKTLFKKGAALIPSLAFLFSSTNLVIELGFILLVLMGWQFTAAEWIGGIVLVVTMAVLVKATYPRSLVEEARTHVEEATHEHDHGDTTIPGTLWQKLRDPRTPVVIAQNVMMDASMLWQDLLLGFLIAGLLAAFVPDGIWRGLFLHAAPPAAQTIANALIGPLIAVITFVCSIGNVPMAAILWSSGISFGGVLAFLYADLIVLPLLDVYRRYYGWKMAAYIGVVFYVTMVVAALIMDGLFHLAGLVPAPNPNVRVALTTFGLDYTFWLNVAFGILALSLWYVDAKHRCAAA
jgi:uncharacterized protein